MDPRNPGRPALVENQEGFTFQLAFALFVSLGSRSPQQKNGSLRRLGLSWCDDEPVYAEVTRP